VLLKFTADQLANAATGKCLISNPGVTAASETTGPNISVGHRFRSTIGATSTSRATRQRIYGALTTTTIGCKIPTSMFDFFYPENYSVSLSFKSKVKYQRLDLYIVSTAQSQPCVGNTIRVIHGCPIIHRHVALLFLNTRQAATFILREMIF
jgi:hypothetical protein